MSCGAAAAQNLYLYSRYVPVVRSRKLRCVGLPFARRALSSFEGSIRVFFLGAIVFCMAECLLFNRSILSIHIAGYVEMSIRFAL